MTTLSLALPGLCRAAAAPSPPPAPGERNGTVIALQAALNDWGQALPWTGYYGRRTEAAIASMQKAAGLPATGTLDLATLVELGLAPGGPVMRLGSKGPDVQALQRALTRAGYSVEVTGLDELQTDGMLRAFQYQHGEKSTGVTTLYAVESVLAVGGAEGVVAAAVDQVGRPYAWAGASPAGFDCSGLVVYAFGLQGLDLAHSSYAQWTAGPSVPAGRLQPGDLVFFTTYAAGPSHVGIYVGDGYFVHAANPRTGVTIDSLDSSYWFQHYIGAVDPFAASARTA